MTAEPIKSFAEELNGPEWPTQLQIDRRRIFELEAALEPFRHMRMQFDAARPHADCEITNIIDGVLCTIGYARSVKEANEFDEIFERVRGALPSHAGRRTIP